MSSRNLFTVAAIRTSPDGKVREYLFNESPSVFRLGDMRAEAAQNVSRINEAFDRKRPIKLEIDSARGVVSKIMAPSDTEVKEFAALRPRLENPQKPRKIDLDKIDHTTFDIVDHYLKFPVFALCTKILPNYAKAKSIFDYCANQTCSLPGPFDINPCIPFQYVRDGCYARAHKMRWIITTKYGYCCEKVFSFANSNMDTLAVQATKWGGCCVTWWYHVAPLIRVKVPLGKFSMIRAMVIDPGMFNQPVALSTWLSAQAVKSCSPNAHVSMYAIQPGSAYSPANYAGTQFSTDNNYTSTDATLVAYKNLHTCP
ncbi:MAG: hypothetical protein HGB29_02605 [Chlorobiaceae bacterium]|nr:hypothetical protein [Chlorobiaceae bacterium]NTW73735.1 hypothetical protein [Chlorobiaceae bacterium]